MAGLPPPLKLGLSLKKINNNDENDSPPTRSSSTVSTVGPTPPGIVANSGFLGAEEAAAHVGTQVVALKNMKGEIVGIRKIAEKAGPKLFQQDLQREIRVYEALHGRSGAAAHILPFKGGGETGDIFYFDMEYVPGFHFLDYHSLHKGMSKKEVAGLLLDALESIEWVYKNGYLHNDITNSNLYVSLGGRGGPKVLVYDFGKATSVKSATRREVRENLEQIGELLQTHLGLTIECEEDLDFLEGLECYKGGLQKAGGGGRGGGGRTRRVQRGQRRRTRVVGRKNRQRK